MIETTVRDCLLAAWEDVDLPEELCGPGIYAVADGNLVFYVGISTHCQGRLLEHYGLIRRPGVGGPSLLGHLIQDNEPESFAWTVRVYEPEEFGHAELALAEIAAIAELRPCLNRTRNDDATPLPERYRVKRRERERELRDKLRNRRG